MATNETKKLCDQAEGKVKRIREKLIDYYGSATPFFPIATADVIRVERMTDDEVIEEAEKLKLM